MPHDYTYKIMISDPEGNVVDVWEIVWDVKEEVWGHPAREYEGIPTYAELEAVLNRHRKRKARGEGGN